MPVLLTNHLGHLGATFLFKAEKFGISAAASGFRLMSIFRELGVLLAVFTREPFAVFGREGLQKV